MEKINAVITGVGGYVPDYILTNDEISKMVDTNDEWIMTRIGVKERHILNEEGLGTSYMARKAAKQLMQRTGSNPDDIDLVIVATSTPDYQFPSIASILCDKLGLKNAFAFDMSAACCGFLYMMETAANFIRSGRYKKVIIVGADKMSSIVNYTDRATCPIFGDGAAAFMMDDVLLAGEKAKAKDPSKWEIVGTPQSFEIYGCMVRKGDTAFKKLVDDTLKATYASGEINQIYNKWFMSPIPPKNVNMNFTMSDNLKNLLANPHDGAQPHAVTAVASNVSKAIASGVAAASVTK